MTFGGDTFSEAQDGQRLRKQLAAVKAFTADEQWYSLADISLSLGYPEASVSARLRDLRKRKFGAYVVQRRRVPNANGLNEYRVLESEQGRFVI